MQLAELASQAVAAHGGRVVKLLGDGVLMHFSRPRRGRRGEPRPDGPAWRVRPAARPYRYHPGPDRRPRRRHLRSDRQSRCSDLDVTPSGELYVPASIGGALSGRFAVTPAGSATLQGIAAIDLARVARPSIRARLGLVPSGHDVEQPESVVVPHRPDRRPGRRLSRHGHRRSVPAARGQRLARDPGLDRGSERADRERPRRPPGREPRSGPA